MEGKPEMTAELPKQKSLEETMRSTLVDGFKSRLQSSDTIDAKQTERLINIVTQGSPSPQSILNALRKTEGANTNE